MKSEQYCDVAVVGAGVAGLMSAAVLARSGRRVLVAERSSTVGGCCRAFSSNGYRFDAAVHHVSGGGARSLLGHALGRVDARLDFTRLDPMDSLTWPDLRFEIPAGWEPLLGALQRSFPREGSGLSALFAELARLYRAALGNGGGAGTLDRWSDKTYSQLLETFVDDERAMRILAGQWGYLGLPPGRLSAIGMVQMIVNYWRDGAYYPRGGMQALPDALAAAVRAAGGVVRTSAGVQRVVRNGDVVIGIDLNDGTRVHAERVIATVDAPQLADELLADEGAFEPAPDLHGLELSAPLFLLYVGLAPGFEPESLPRGFYHREARTDGPWVYVSCPTTIDPTLAPPGHHAVTVVLSLDDRDAQCWDWIDRKEVTTRAAIGFLDTIAPGFRRHAELIRTAHPPMPDRRTRGFCGAPYGWAVTPAQSGARRSALGPHCQGLRLAGQWAAPGPGVCAAIASGWAAANAILAEPTEARVAAS